MLLGAMLAPLARLDKPSIAVLPFINMSGDAEQEIERYPQSTHDNAFLLWTSSAQEALLGQRSWVPPDQPPILPARVRALLSTDAGWSGVCVDGEGQCR